MDYLNCSKISGCRQGANLKWASCKTNDGQFTEPGLVLNFWIMIYYFVSEQLGDLEG